MNRTQILNIKVFLSLLIVLMCLSNCGKNNFDESFEITVNQLHQKYLDGEKFYLLDVRTTPEFIEKRVPFADNMIPYDSLEFYKDKLPEDKATVIYSFCRSGRRSGISTAYLRSIGYDNAYNVAGGIIAWEEAGFQIKTGP